jgi:hypothetical protein
VKRWKKIPESSRKNACSYAFFRLYLQGTISKNVNLHKEATNQSLNQKSRCFYIGALFFRDTSLCAAFLCRLCAAIHHSLITTLAHTADQHLYLLAHISTRQLDRRNRNSFETNSVATCIAYKVNMIVMMLSTGTVVFA